MKDNRIRTSLHIIRSDLRDFNRAILIRPMACIMGIEMCYGRIWLPLGLEAKQIEAQPHTVVGLDWAGLDGHADSFQND